MHGHMNVKLFCWKFYDLQYIHDFFFWLGHLVI
jgi:hypothetical protein